MTVLVTGAAGRIGGELMRALPEFGWTVRGFDRVADEADNVVVGELGSPADLDAAMTGVQAVVHLAGQPTEAAWPVVREANIEGTFQLFEAARRAGIARVVYASSNHATGFTPVAAELPVDTQPRPDTLYGVSKVFGEVLGRYYSDRYGLQVACVRIGTFAPAPRDHRSLSTWLSPGDCARLVDACLRAPELSYALVWGVSANTRRTWSLESARALGYEPQDDSEDYADQVGSGPEPSEAYVGGSYTTADYGIDRFTGGAGDE